MSDNTSCFGGFGLGCLRLLCVSLVLAVGSGVCQAAVYDITSYGAIANDGVDDLSAINVAIAHAGVGDTVYAPTGVFDISGSVVLKSDLKFLGAGRDATTLKYKATGGGSNNAVLFDTVYNAEMANLTVDGNMNRSLRTGVFLYRGNYYNSVHDTRIKNIYSDESQSAVGLRVGYNSRNNLFENNIIENVWDFDPVSGDPKQGGTGISLQGDSHSNRIIGNTTNNMGRNAMWMDHCSDVIVRGNTMTNNGLMGIEIQGAPRCLVEDNVMDKWMTVASMDYGAVRRNTVGHSGSSTEYAGIETGSGFSSHVVITDNVLDDGHHYGIAMSVNASDHYLVAHNEMRNMNSHGLLIGQNDHSYFYKNEIEDNAGGFGVLIDHGGAEYLVFDGNTIDDNGSQGIQRYNSGDHMTVINNAITNNGGNSVGPYPYWGSNVQWSGNTVNGNANDYEWTPVGYTDGTPTLAISCPTNAVVGQQVTFEMDFKDPEDGAGDPEHDATPTTVLWDFGEGNPTGDATSHYTYEEPGLYRVMAVAWDSYGRGVIDETYINVAVPEPGTIVLLGIGVVALLIRRRVRLALVSRAG